MAACTLEESVPHRVGRSAGLWKVLIHVLGTILRSRMTLPYLRAARRHAGGAATATCAVAVKSARRMVDLANILKVGKRFGELIML